MQCPLPANVAPDTQYLRAEIHAVHPAHQHGERRYACSCGEITPTNGRPWASSACRKTFCKRAIRRPREGRDASEPEIIDGVSATLVNTVSEFLLGKLVAAQASRGAIGKPGDHPRLRRPDVRA